MIRLLHLLPIIVVIATVTAALRAAEPKGFKREFLTAGLSLAVGFAGLAVVVFLLGLLI